jgi:hypothetical protein
MADFRNLQKILEVWIKMSLPRPARLIIIVVVAALMLTMMTCAAGAAFNARRVDLFHAAVFDSCAMQAYQLHWQNGERHPRTYNYDFSLSPVSFVMVEIWFEDGQTLKFSRGLALNCGEPSSAR